MISAFAFRYVKFSTALVFIACLSFSDVYADAATNKSRIYSEVDTPSEQSKVKARTEVEALKQLPETELVTKASNNDNLAGLALAHLYSEESQSLANLPVLANSAAEDAARWYSIAARMNPRQSLSIRAVSVKPLRATRSKKH